MFLKPTFQVLQTRANINWPCRLGASFPFFIDDGIAAAFARAYELGLYGQRSHGDDPAVHALHARCGSHHARKHPDAAITVCNRVEHHRQLRRGHQFKQSAQTAPLLTNEAAQLFPFVNTEQLTFPAGILTRAITANTPWTARR